METKLYSTIKEKIIHRIYSIYKAPRIIYIDTSGIYVNKKAPYPSETESFEDMDWERDKMLTQKLKQSSYGDLQFHIGIINIKHLDSREILDNLYVDKIRQSNSKNFERISIEKALEHFDIELSCDMDFYLNNKHEIEVDLNKKNVNFDLKNDYQMRRLEKELFYNQMCKLFGDKEDTSDDFVKQEDEDEKIYYEKAFILKDFHVLFMDGNYLKATARRGNFYLLFSFVN
ncbi:unnamed protein product [Brachionus calyciflorus]|uniref:Uncharacterized protein n=1 Tax=Brachionus calyciflorus TaxID=104777 RepID=A0A813Q5Q4_9BILA|nr:unnamed protein product [Brachionus calyciflorus]